MVKCKIVMQNLVILVMRHQANAIINIKARQNLDVGFQEIQCSKGVQVRVQSYL